MSIEKKKVVYTLAARLEGTQADRLKVYERCADECEICRYILADRQSAKEDEKAIRKGPLEPVSESDRVGFAYATALGNMAASAMAGRRIPCCEAHSRMAANTTAVLLPLLMEARAEYEASRNEKAEKDDPQSTEERLAEDAKKPAAERAN
jgi:hypothetical protein